MTATNERSTATEGLKRLERLFADAEWPWRRALGAARERAERRARAALDGGGRPADVQNALRVFAAEMFSELGIELAAHPDEAARLAELVEQRAGVARMALGREVLRSPDLLSLPPAVAVEVQLALLRAFAPLCEASLWTRDATGRVRCLGHVGGEAASEGVRTLAERLLTDKPETVCARGELLAVPVQRWQQSVAVLAGRAHDGQRDRCRVLMEDAIAILSAVLERDDRLSRDAASEQVLARASERRLTRLRFDLHDGPLQDLALLAQDLRLFREQLDPALEGRNRDKLLGRIDDLDAELALLDADLRRLSTSLESPLMRHQSLSRALEHVVDAFASRTGSKPTLKLAGDLTSLSDSQQMALFSIIREGLSNIREHSNATEVTITVTADNAHIAGEVVDNGCGFDVEATLLCAARDGHLGLVGIHERARLLGGHSRIDSQPGGPTVLSIVLPRWQPVAGARPTHAAS